MDTSSSATACAPGLTRLQRRVAAALLALLSIVLSCTGTVLAQLSTEDHLAESDFWPTKGQPSEAVFSGNQACTRCHAGIARMATLSSMARTAVHASGAELLQQHPHLEFHYANDVFRIETSGSPKAPVSTYSVSDGNENHSDSLLWIFGTGRVGQSYLFKKADGQFYESRMTFFRSLNNIGFTPSRELTAPTDLGTAMGRRVDSAELIRCFSCHATAVNIQDKFNEAGLRGGVTCEACHGPGAAHVAAMAHPAAAGTAEGKSAAIFEPSHLSPIDSVEFCGSCHGSWWDVKLAHVSGPSTVRSAPYRLVTSKCWGVAGDPRLVCTACHNPHQELVTDLSSYDAACLRCHAASTTAAAHPAQSAAAAVEGSAPRAPACPVGKTKCASCHMPQVYVPEMKNTFTDHRIRVVKAGEPFQN